MRRITLTISAYRDLDEIWDYIAVENRNPIAAGKLIDEFDDHFQLLSLYPMIGESIDRLRTNTRRVVVRKRYFVFYEARDEGILVLRVLRSARLIRSEDLAS